MTQTLEMQLTKRTLYGNLRQLQLAAPKIDFASNDYLGLARSPELAAAVLEEWHQHEHLRLGSTGSRLLTGNSSYAEQLEEMIATFHGYPAGLLFSCGYMANIGLLSAITTSKSTIVFDASIHASIRDGLRLSKAQAFPFRHNDLDHLEYRLKQRPVEGDLFICIESLYSTDGSTAPLQDICRLAKRYDAHLIVDEAHAVGVCGPEGRGLIAKHHLMPDIFAQVITFGKALGTYGAIVLGSALLKRALVNFATSFIYTTALPFYMLAAIQCSYAIFPNMEKERQHLEQLIYRISKTPFQASGTHIQALSIPGNAAVKEVSQALSKNGFDIRPLMSPTVQKGHEILRLSLHAFNTEKELFELFNLIRTLGIYV